MIQRIDIRRGENEKLHYYLFRMYLLLRGKRHSRYAKYLLFIGVALLTPSIIDLLILLIESFNINPDEPFSFSYAPGPVVGFTQKLAAFCIIVSPVVFLSGEYISTRVTSKRNLPLIDPSIKAQKSLSALKYMAEGVIQFAGRSEEFSSLKNFVESAEIFSWCAISGRGAAGKSRLALELCRYYTKRRWCCGFYDEQTSGPALVDWNPKNAHLIVIDYAGRNIDVPAAVIKRAIHLSRSGDLIYPIRLIIIDRDTEPTVNRIARLPTFGESAKQCLSAESVLILSAITEEVLDSVVLDLCNFFELGNEHHEDILRYVRNSSSSRKILVAGLVALRLYQVEGGELDDSIQNMIRDLVSEERDKHWNRLGFDADLEKYLIAATMADGINLNELDSFGPKAKEFLQLFSGHEVYKSVTGEIDGNILGPLSHDVVSELHVLESFDLASQDDQTRFHELVQICLQIKAGRGMLNFFTRAANDWPGHSSLSLLLPRFGQTPETVTVWLALMANVIDKININDEERVGIFHRVVTGLLRDDIEFMRTVMHILEGLFLRILWGFGNDDRLVPWLRDYEIIVVESTRLEIDDDCSQEEANEETQDSIVQVETIADNLQVKPREYCDSVISVFSNADLTLRKRLVWPGLLELFHHAILHRIVERDADLEEVKELLAGIVDNASDSWNLNRIFRDVVAGIIQFNHVRRQSERALILVDFILGVSRQNLRAEGLASLLTAISGAYGHMGVSYDKKRNLFGVWKDALDGPKDTQDEAQGYFASFAVAMMHRFKDKEDLYFALEVLKEVEELVASNPEGGLIDCLAMCYGQLTRQEKGYLSDEGVIELVDKLADLVSMHSETSPEIGGRAVNELSTIYRNWSNDGRTGTEAIFQSGMRVIRDLAGKDIKDQTIYPGGLLETAFQNYLSPIEPESLKNLCDIVAELQSMPEVNIDQFFQMVNSLYQKYGEAMTNSDISSAEEIVEVAQYWIEHLKNNQPVLGVFSHMVEDFDRRRG